MKIKIISLVLSVVMLISSFSVLSFAEGGALMGDINKSGALDTEDARAILRMAAGIIAPDALIADMNGDGVVTVDDAIKALSEAANIGGVVIPDKNGENYLSDSPNNEFIKLIASNYNKNPKSLVAIYSVPDSGTNYVLEFKKSVIGDNYEKSPKNLKVVYHIGAKPERKISYTDGSVLSGPQHHFNCEPAEGILTFNLIKTKVMQQYPEYFVGLK